MKFLVFSSPHTITTIRFRKFKIEIHKKELYIKEILDKLKERGYNVIYNKFDIIDPNFHRISLFKKLVYIGQTHNIDLHGMGDCFGIDICIGTWIMKYDLSKVEEFLEKKGIRYSINHPFSARRHDTITKYLQKKGVKAIQLELSLNFRKRRDAVDIIEKLGKIWLKM